MNFQFTLHAISRYFDIIGLNALTSTYAKAVKSCERCASDLKNISERENTVSLPQYIEPDARLKAAKLTKTRILQNPTISLKFSGLLTLPERSLI